MSEQGEPIISVQTYTETLPDGRKVTKTRTTKTYKQQVQVPAGQAPPPGAYLVSTGAGPETAQSHSTTSTTHHSYSSSNGDQNNGGYHQQQVQQQSHHNSEEPSVVVQTTVDDNGRKVTKTTTKTSSSGQSSSPFSKFFKKLGGDDDDEEVTKTEEHHVQHLSVSNPIKKIEVELESKKVSLTQLSACTGERRALLIGINYIGQANTLHGCINDTAVMKKFLLEVGFEEDKIRVLTDDQVGTDRMPTKENIFKHMNWLVGNAIKNDSYFLHYSGHGSQVKDLDNDEANGMDNVIFPCDHSTNGVILDDDLHTTLVKSLPSKVRLTVVFDCCHSGSALDLPYIYTSTGYVRGTSAIASMTHDLVENKFAMNEILHLSAKWKRLQLEEKELERQIKLKSAHADVVMFSGCTDDQTSADVSVTKRGQVTSNGALTYAFTKTLRENPTQSYQEILNNVRDMLVTKYNQKSQLSSSHQMDTSKLFKM